MFGLSRQISLGAAAYTWASHGRRFATVRSGQLAILSGQLTCSATPGVMVRITQTNDHGK